MSDINAESSGPLSGYRVIELAAWVAGPAAGGIMADWGADVIKVETASGDPQRTIFGAIGTRDDLPVPPFEIDNRGKRSIVLDLRSDDGTARFHQLLETADVMVTNTRPGALERLGLDHETVLDRHPRLVYGLITGYGLEGPDRDRAGYDVGAYWARSGLAHSLVPPGELPPQVRSGMGDHQTGITLVSGVVAKLLERERTGRGGLVATSLLRTGLYSLGWDIGIQLRFGRRQSTRPRERFPTPLINSYAAGDGHGFFLICLEGDRHWPQVLAAIGHPELGDDERYATNRLRSENCEALIADLDAVFQERDMAEWADRFDAHDVWWAPIQTIREVVEDPQAQPGFVDMTPHDGEEPFRAVATPVDFDGHEQRPGPVPYLGEHTAEIMSELDG